MNAATVFLERLDACPLDTWREAARTGVTPGLSDAVALMEALCAQADYMIEDWYARDGTRTAAARFERVLGLETRARREEYRALIAVTERAARALLVRDELAPDIFDALYAPFAALVPVATLQEA